MTTTPATGANPPAQAATPKPPAKKERVKVDPNETKEAKFKRVAQSRVNSALRYLGLVGNCFNGPGYSFTEDQVKIVFDALTAAVEAAKPRKGPETDAGFKL